MRSVTVTIQLAFVVQARTNASERQEVDFKSVRQELSASLAKLHGIEEVKRKVHELIKKAMLRKFSASYLKDEEISKAHQNMAFLGPPGTGKTTLQE